MLVRLAACAAAAARAVMLVALLSTAVAIVAPIAAQQIPSPAQAQQMLRQDPGLINRLQQMMQSSGLTPDQVRERLRAAGYPDSLLNAYLPGGTVGFHDCSGRGCFRRGEGIGAWRQHANRFALARGGRPSSHPRALGFSIS